MGDAPLPGLGTYADEHVAISCTGKGEAFMEAATAARLAKRAWDLGAKVGPLCRRHWETLRQLRLAETEQFLFDNGTGAFSADGREYVMVLREGGTTPAPWANRYDPDWQGPLLIWPPYATDTLASGLLTPAQARHIRANYGAT